MTIRNSPERARVEFQAGLRDITPLTFGVAVYGLAFGLMAGQIGMGGGATGAMGLLVFAGSAQIVAVERLASHAGPIMAIVAGLALNLRILLMTASLRTELARRPWWQVALGVHLTSDENWALMHATRRHRPVGYWYLVGGGASLMSVWVVVTGLAAAFADLVPDPSALGLGFAFTAAFIALACNLWRGKSDLFPWVASASLAAGLALFAPIDPSWALIAGGLAGAVLAGMRGDV